MHREYILLNGFRKAKKVFTAGFHVSLNMCASGILLCSTFTFSIFFIPSTRGDLFSFMLLILPVTTSGVTINCSNIQVFGSLNCVTGVVNEVISSLVNNELKCLFNYSAIKNMCYYIPSIILQWSNFISNILLTSYIGISNITVSCMLHQYILKVSYRFSNFVCCCI